MVCKLIFRKKFIDDQRKNSIGFTLVEMIAVIAILSVLIVISVTAINGLKKKSEENLYNEQVKRIENAAQLWAIDNNGHISKTSVYYLTLEELVEDEFLNNDNIYDPRSNELMTGCVGITYDGSNYSYTYDKDCLRTTYGIQYTLNGGRVNNNPTIYTSETTTFTLNNPIRIGYTFLGWTGTGLNSATTSVSIAKGSTGNRAYIANWQRNVYSITYELNGGMVVAANPTQYYGDSPNMIINPPVRQNYKFTGWTGTGLSGLTFNLIIPKGSTGNRTYTANWELNVFEIAFDNQGATTVGSTSATATYNAAMPSITVPSKTGYTFGGYYTETNGGGTQYYNGNGSSAHNWDREENTTLYAKWIANSYTIILNNQDATTAGSTSVTATYNAAIPSITIPTKTNYVFTGYYTEVNEGGTQYYNGNGTSMRAYDLTSNIILYAGWGQEKYSYAYSGEYKEFNAPSNGMYKIELWGASGFGATGGGGYTSGNIYLNKGTKLYIYVGGSGKSGVGAATSGWNGGGAAGSTGSSGGGGGSTDVRLVSTTSVTAWNETASLNSRIMVAGGSGGAENGLGAGGGGIFGYGNNAGIKSSQSNGGGFGYGCSYNGDGSGGGGGYFGGYCPTADSVAGGGGSSYISGHSGCSSITSDSTSTNIINTGNAYHYSGNYFTNTLMIDGMGYAWTSIKSSLQLMPSQSEGNYLDSGKGNIGNGYARITFVQPVTKSSFEIQSQIRNNVYAYYQSNRYQKFYADRAGTYRIELWGASGFGAAGGGGYTSGTINLEKGATFYVYVGSTGKNGVGAATAGWNGGGAAGSSGSSGGGGGSTDIRLVPTSSLAVWNEATSLNSRIMVAGGSGGAENGTGAGGGGILGYGNNAGTQATQIVGSSFGAGCSYNGDGSGAGGGYFGGYCPTGDSVGGGGGSSYISGHTGCVAITSSSDRTPKSGCTVGTTDNNCSKHYSGRFFSNTVMIDGMGYSWTNTKGNLQLMPNQYGGNLASGKGNLDFGYAKITYIG